MKIFSLQSVARTATVAIVFALCANSAARHQYKIPVDLNQIYREELADVWRLKCDGVEACLHNSWFMSLQEWQAAFDLLGPGEVYTEDDYFELTSFNKAVEIVGLENVLMGCGYVEPDLTPEYQTETLTDDKIDERYANQQGKKVLVLARAYWGYRQTEVQRALRNPKVGGVIWELGTDMTYTQSLNVGPGIRDVLASGKKCFLLVPRFTRAGATELYRWIIANAPEALDNPNFYIIPAAYIRNVQGFVFYGGDNSVEGAIKRLKELRGDPQMTRQIALLNGGFEKPVSDFFGTVVFAEWTIAQETGVTWSTDSDAVLSGRCAAKFDNTRSPSQRMPSPETYQGSISQTIDFDAGGPFQAHYFSKGSVGFTLTLKIEWLDTSRNVIAADASTMASVDEWTLHEITGVSPVGTARARLSIEVASTNGLSKGSIGFDDVWLTGASDLSNGGFEDGVFAPWMTTRSGGVTWDIDEDTVLDGHFSARYGNTWWLQTISNGSIYQTIYFTANEPFAASYLARGSTGYTLTLRIDWLDTFDRVIATDASTMASADEWSLHEVTGTSPAGTVRARLTIEVADSGEPSNGTIYFDDASLMPL